MQFEATGDDWVPGPISPKPVKRTVSMSVRIPAELYDALASYAKQLRSSRSYLIVECLRRLIDSHHQDRGKVAPRGRSAGTPRRAGKSR